MNGADIGWMILATGMVLLMTPALAFFYGGLVRSKNALNTMMMSFASLAVVGVLWALAGYTFAFAPGNAVIGGLDYLFLRGVDLQAKGAIPHLLFMCYQGTFAVITAALVSGAIVERMRFSAYLVFIALWSLVVYAPVAHWVWGGGWLGTLGTLDFAGGTVVHVNAAVAALVAALVLGPRRDHGRQAFLPHNVPLVLLGTGLLWFGWLGFNGGSALAANGLAAAAFTNTFFAPAAAAAAWALIELLLHGKVSGVGLASGAVAGMVAITPAAGYVTPLSALLLGALAAAASFAAVRYRPRLGLDDSLDVFAVHGVAATLGALLTGVLATKAVNPDAADGSLALLGVQAIGVAVTFLWSGLLSWVLFKLVGLVTPLRADEQDEWTGLDMADAGERAYVASETESSPHAAGAS